MDTFDFSIDDIDFKDGKELIGIKKLDSDELNWWPMEEQGSGFMQLFRGSIKRAIEYDKGCQK
jgi:hypothetical protein